MFIDVARSVVDPSRPFFLWQLHWPSSSNRRATKGSALASLQGSFCFLAELQIESRPEKFYKIIGNFPWRRRQNERLTENPVSRALLNGVEDNGSRPPMKTLRILAFMLICSLGVAQGALQCFAPMRLRQLQKRFRPSADWTASAGGKLLEGLAERQAGHPTLAHRATGLLLMAFFIYLLAAAIGRLMH
jgi:hypothetical protein